MAAGCGKPYKCLAFEATGKPHGHRTGDVTVENVMHIYYAKEPESSTAIQTARYTRMHTCKFPLPSVSAERRYVERQRALHYSLSLSSLVHRPGNIYHGAGQRHTFIIQINQSFFYLKYTSVLIINLSTTSNMVAASVVGKEQFFSLADPRRR